MTNALKVPKPKAKKAAAKSTVVKRAAARSLVGGFAGSGSGGRGMVSPLSAARRAISSNPQQGVDIAVDAGIITKQTGKLKKSYA